MYRTTKAISPYLSSFISDEQDSIRYISLSIPLYLWYAKDSKGYISGYIFALSMVCRTTNAISPHLSSFISD